MNQDVPKDLFFKKSMLAREKSQIKMAAICKDMHSIVLSVFNIYLLHFKMFNMCWSGL